MLTDNGFERFSQNTYMNTCIISYISFLLKADCRSKDYNIIWHLLIQCSYIWLQCFIIFNYTFDSFMCVLYTELFILYFMKHIIYLWYKIVLFFSRPCQSVFVLKNNNLQLFFLFLMLLDFVKACYYMWRSKQVYQGPMVPFS